MILVCLGQGMDQNTYWTQGCHKKIQAKVNIPRTSPRICHWQIFTLLDLWSFLEADWKSKPDIRVKMQLSNPMWCSLSKNGRVKPKQLSVPVPVPVPLVVVVVVVLSQCPKVFVGQECKFCEAEEKAKLLVQMVNIPTPAKGEVAASEATKQLKQSEVKRVATVVVFDGF